MTPVRPAAAVAAAALLCAGGTAHAAADALPDGPGKQMVQTACAGCHELSRVTRAGHTAQDWRNVLHMMINVGAQVPADQVGIVTAYLARNFPEKPRPSPAPIAGSVRVSFQEWEVPTPGSRPHDPLATRDGAIWYTGQMANALGRLDPATGQIREFHPPTANAGPHGLAADRDGNIWFTENFAGAIGKLDPRTGHVTEYALPDRKARDPHTPLFDANGVLWFTVQGGNMVGRLDPATGAIRLVTVPTPRANPYGMVISSHGVPFFAEFGANKLASIDPQTMAIREYTLPHPGSRPRRVAITPDDAIWYSVMRAACWAGSIRRAGRSPNGRRPAVRIPRPMRSRF